MALPSFTATLNTSPDPPASNQFILNDASGPLPVNSLILIDDITTITITLAGDATFPPLESLIPPIVWSLPPDGNAPTPILLSDSTLAFAVPAPTHVLHPWVFRFIVNAPVVPDGPVVNGIRSQNIYLSKTLSGNTLYLEYNPSNGNFSLTDSLGSPQAGAILGEDLVLVNTQLNGNVTVNVVNMVNDIVLDPPPNFASEPIVWSSGSPPGWITPPPPGEGTPTISFGIDQPSGMGQGIGLQFAIVVDDQTILSPDPILINTTIGDG